MKKLMVPIALLLAAGTQPALAGPVDSVIPTNNCSPAQGSYRLIAVFNSVGTDSGGSACGAGGNCAETIVTCVNGQSFPVDIVLEWFNGATGASLGVSSEACAIATGATATFVTRDNYGVSSNSIYEIDLLRSFPGGPGANTVAVPELSSLRVLSSSPNVLCEAALYQPNTGAGPTWSQDVINTKRNVGQRGD